MLECVSLLLEGVLRSQRLVYDGGGGDTDTGEDTSGEDRTPDIHPGTGPGNDPDADGN